MYAEVQPILSPDYTENLLPYASMFNDTSVLINKTFGTPGSYITYDPSRRYVGANSIKMFGDDSLSSVDFNFGNALQHTVKSGRYWITARLEKSAAHTFGQGDQPELQIKVTKNGVYTAGDNVICRLPYDDNPYGFNEEMQPDKFYVFSGYVDVSSDDTVLNYLFSFRPNSLEDGQATVWLHGLKVERASTYSNGFSPSVYTLPYEGRPRQLHGNYNYQDTATQTTPIALTSGVFATLTNDALGANTNVAGRYPEVANVWNIATQRFDWSGFSINDNVTLRVDVEITTASVNQTVNMDLVLGVGVAGEFRLPIVPELYYKDAGAHKIVASIPIGMLTALVKNNPAKIDIKTTGGAGSVKVNGWFVTVQKWKV